MKYEIKNEHLKATFSDIGGMLVSLIDLKNNKELVHEISDGGWDYSDVIIFPIISKYPIKVDDKTYFNPTNHGLIRNKKVEFLKGNLDNEITMVYTNSNEDLNVYPYKFRVMVNFKLDKNKYIVTTQIKNLDDKTMYYNLGFHPAFKANTNTIVKLNDNTKYFPLVNDEIDFNTPKFLDNKISLDPELFKNLKTIVLENKTTKIEVINDEYILKYNMFSPLIAVWTNPNVPSFLCVEPWFGASIYKDQPLELKDRYYINSLNPNSLNTYQFSIEIESK